MKKELVTSIIAVVNATLTENTFSVQIQDTQNNLHSVSEYLEKSDDVIARNVCVFFDSVDALKQVRFSIYTNKMTFNKLLAYATRFIESEKKKDKDNFYYVKDFSQDRLSDILHALQIAQIMRCVDANNQKYQHVRFERVDDSENALQIDDDIALALTTEMSEISEINAKNA